MGALEDDMCLYEGQYKFAKRTGRDTNMCIVTPIALRSDTWRTGAITSRPRSYPVANQHSGSLFPSVKATSGQDEEDCAQEPPSYIEDQDFPDGNAIL